MEVDSKSAQSQNRIDEQPEDRKRVLTHRVAIWSKSYPCHSRPWPCIFFFLPSPFLATIISAVSRHVHLTPSVPINSTTSCTIQPLWLFLTLLFVSPQNHPQQLAYSNTCVVSSDLCRLQPVNSRAFNSRNPFL